MGDQVPRLYARVIGGGAIHGGDDLDEALFHGDLDPQPAKGAAGLAAHLIEVVGRQVARMRIERGQHAVDRGLDQLFGSHFLDILGADAFEHVAEQVELLVHRTIALLLLRHQRTGHLRRQNHPGNDAADPGQNMFLHHASCSLFLGGGGELRRLCTRTGRSILPRSQREPGGGVNRRARMAQFDIERLCPLAARNCIFRRIKPPNRHGAQRHRVRNHFS